ncbi:MAG: hypothetical protein ABSC54_06800 [Smithellaceae bacterium]
MKIRNQFTVRALVVYAVALAAAWILIEVVWGATGGIIGGLSFSRNVEYQQKVTSFMKDKGINSGASRDEALKAYQALSEEDKKELMEMSKKILSDINWFSVSIFVSAVAFGIVGFFGGLISRTWLLAGAVPALSFLLNNPIIRFQIAKDISTLQKVVVVVFAQFAVCYLLAYLGARLGLRRKHKKETVNEAMKATV